MNRDGYALVAALWFLVLVSAISLDAAYAARGHRLLAAGLAEGVRARYAAAAGLVHARARLATLGRLSLTGIADDVQLLVNPWGDVESLLPDTVVIEQSRYHVVARDANAVLNLNRADESQIRNLLLALRVDARLADRIAQATLDWRDADDFRRVNGGERLEYLKESRPVLPGNGPFASLDDVRYVLGMTDALFARLKPYVGGEGSGRSISIRRLRLYLLRCPASATKPSR